MSTCDLFDRVLASLHEAAIDPGRWSAAAGLINEASGAKGHALGVGGGGWPHSKILFARISFGRQRREDLEQEYFRDHWARDDRIPRLVRLPLGRLTHTSDLYTDEEKKTSCTYNELLRHVRAQNGLNVRLESPEGLHIMWLFADSIAPGGWDSVQIETIERLLPHVRQFARVRQAVADAGALGSSLAELLDNVRFGVIQLDRHARIVAANDRARSLLRQGGGLVDQRGHLSACTLTEDDELQRLLGRALPPLGVRCSAGSMTIGRSSVRPRLAVHITPMAMHQWDFRERRVAALVLVVDPESRSRIDPGVVGETLGLTPAESRLAVMVASGHTLRDIAAVTERSYDTVRWHLQKIFRKQGISRQAALVRRVLSLDGFPESRR